LAYYRIAHHICPKFLDHLVKNTRQGGLEAVHHLKSTVCEYVSKQLELPRHIDIRIRIYANKRGLASAYCYNEILESTGDFDTFVRGFNMGNPMCDFMDAGDGKECADSKLKGNAEAYGTSIDLSWEKDSI
jgi:hypothetical protein